MLAACLSIGRSATLILVRLKAFLSCLYSHLTHHIHELRTGILGSTYLPFTSRHVRRSNQPFIKQYLLSLPRAVAITAQEEAVWCDIMNHFSGGKAANFSVADGEAASHFPAP